MEKKNLIKAGIVAAFLIAASMFGFTAAHGYGGGSNVNFCTDVQYGDWQGCVMGVQWRNVISQNPIYCVLSGSQQAARVKSCAQVSACTSITYGAWSGCFLGVQSRSIANSDPSGCKITAAQELARLRTCGSKRVLGVKIYAAGTLLRTPDGKIYVVTDGSNLQYIPDLQALSKYVGHKMFNVDYSAVGNSTDGSVLGVKIYPDGTLLRGPDKKIFVLIGGKKEYISSLADLYQYRGHLLYNVSSSTIANY